MTIGELVNNLAQKAGISADDAKLKSLLASPELATIQVDDTIVTGIENGLLSIDAAKNNHPDIKKKYFADAYDGMDKQLIALVASDTFDQADLDEIKAEKSTSKKAELIVTKLKAAKASAKGADKDEINKQLNAAHEVARLAKEEVVTVKNTYEGKIKDIQLKAAIKAVFGNYKTIYDELPPAVRTATMEAIIMQGLQDKNAELKTDEHGNLQLLAKDGSNVFGADHVQLTPQSFLDKTFAPILKVSGTPPPAAPRQNVTVPTGNTPQEQHNSATSDFVKSHTAQVLADMALPKATLV
jgi:hypothetical protein